MKLVCEAFNESKDEAPGDLMVVDLEFMPLLHRLCSSVRRSALEWNFHHSWMSNYPVDVHCPVPLYLVDSTETGTGMAVAEILTERAEVDLGGEDPWGALPDCEWENHFRPMYTHFPRISVYPEHVNFVLHMGETRIMRSSSRMLLSDIEFMANNPGEWPQSKWESLHGLILDHTFKRLGYYD